MQSSKLLNKFYLIGKNLLPTIVPWWDQTDGHFLQPFNSVNFWKWANVSLMFKLGGFKTTQMKDKQPGYALQTLNSL